MWLWQQGKCPHHRPALQYLLEPTSAECLLQKHSGAANAHVPIIIVSSNAFESVNLRRDTQGLRAIGRTMDIISQPCGPQKLATAFERCLYQEPFTAPLDVATASLPGARLYGHNEGVDPSFQNQDSNALDNVSGPRSRLSGSAAARSELAKSRPSIDSLAEAMSVS